MPHVYKMLRQSANTQDFMLIFDTVLSYRRTTQIRSLMVVFNFRMLFSQFVFQETVKISPRRGSLHGWLWWDSGRVLQKERRLHAEFPRYSRWPYCSHLFLVHIIYIEYFVIGHLTCRQRVIPSIIIYDNRQLLWNASQRKTDRWLDDRV